MVIITWILITIWTKQSLIQIFILTVVHRVVKITWSVVWNGSRILQRRASCKIRSIFVSEYRVSLYFVVLLKWCQSYPEAAVWNLYWWTWKRQCDQQRLSFSAQISNHNHDRDSYNFRHLLRKYPTVRGWCRGPEIVNKDYYVTSGIENCVSLMIPNRISEDPFCSFGQF